MMTTAPLEMEKKMSRVVFQEGSFGLNYETVFPMKQHTKRIKKKNHFPVVFFFSEEKISAKFLIFFSFFYISRISKGS